jgi:transcriptional regulator with XRE-family HTH domain
MRDAPRRRLRDARVSLGLLQRDVAARSGVCRSRVSAAETGTWWPHPKTLRRLAEACGVSVTWVLTGEA